MAPTLNQTVLNFLMTTMSSNLVKDPPRMPPSMVLTSSSSSSSSSLLHEGEAREGRAVGLGGTQDGVSGGPHRQWSPSTTTPEEETQQNLMQQRYQEYVIGLSILIAMISIGILVSVFMCLTVRRHPYLWLAVFGGKKTSLAGRNTSGKLPRRVRFQIRRSHDRDQCSTDSGVTMIVPGYSVIEEPNPGASSKGDLVGT
ncbi:uncharacterized protein LOC143034166 [Oratosquilla oratoria]|uniref:uncharacterized protein LOC143034166 n=1 Tax=Oratosquilla oratoria TaxID=337810 RepID=UPI003F765BC9